jgi:7-cyano-7-deazaguanine synthase in queuosine biosynthesis
MSQRVVLLLSGGLDSVLSLAELLAKPIEEVERVHAFIIDYDQSSRVEVQRAKELCEAWRVPYTVFNTVLATDTDTHAEIPARNLLFISYAAAFAIKMHFNTVAIGFEPDSTYTDSSVEFADKANNLLEMFDLELITPVKHYANKLVLVQRALDLGVPLHLCHSSRSNVVDGKCKTSKLFLDALHTMFPGESQPIRILEQLAGLGCEYDKARNCYKIYYQFGDFKYPFKYAAALFAILSETMQTKTGTVQVHSTGSWSECLKAAALQYKGTITMEFHNTQDTWTLLNQELNVSDIGIKQALSLLPRPRYMKDISCRVVQGHLASALHDLGYRVCPPTLSCCPHLETVI